MHNNRLKKQGVKCKIDDILRKFFCCLILPLYPVLYPLSYCLASNFSSDAIGTTGAQFLELPVGARAIAMGSAAGAVADDATAIYYNPAGLASVEYTNLSFMQAFYFGDISYQFGAVATKFPNKKVLAFGLQYLRPGEMEKVDNTGKFTDDSFKPYDLALTVGYAKRIDMLGIDVGIAGKYIRSQIDKAAVTSALDAGVRFKVTSKVTMSGSLLNLGSGLVYHERTSSLPTSVRIGSAFNLPRNILLSADLIAPKGASMHLALGAEHCVYTMVNTENMEILRLLLRGGYNGRNTSSKLGRVTGLSAGIGFEFSTWMIDYAWSSFGELDPVHRISLTKQFGTLGYLESRAEARVWDIPFTPRTTAFVKTKMARVHSNPSIETRIIDEIKMNEEVKVILQRGNWVQVNTMSGKIGWVHKSVLRRNTAFVKTKMARLRSNPGTKTRVITDVKMGEEVEIILQRGNWVQVNTMSGQTGWMHKSVLQEKNK